MSKGATKAVAVAVAVGAAPFAGLGEVGVVEAAI